MRNASFINHLENILKNNRGDERNKAFLIALDNDEVYLKGEISQDDLKEVAALIPKYVKGRIDRIILSEGIAICLRHAACAAEIRALSASAVPSALKPIVILNIHTDPGQYFLLYSALEALCDSGYTQFCTEDPIEGLNHAEQLSGFKSYANQMNKAEQSKFAYALSTRQEVSKQFLTMKLPEMKQAVVEAVKTPDSTSLRERTEEFHVKVNQLRFGAPFLEKALNHSKCHLSPFDHRSTEEQMQCDLTDINLDEFSKLRDIGFAFRIALNSFKAGTIVNVGVAHGKGILDRYHKLFPSLPQPVAFFPCHYHIDSHTFNFICDAIRLQLHIIDGADSELQDYAYQRLEMAGPLCTFSLEQFKYFIQHQVLPSESRALTTTAKQQVLGYHRDDLPSFDSIKIQIESWGGDCEYSQSVMTCMSNTNTQLELMQKTKNQLLETGQQLWKEYSQSGLPDRVCIQAELSICGIPNQVIDMTDAIMGQITRTSLARPLLWQQPLDKVLALSEHISTEPSPDENTEKVSKAIVRL